MEESVIVNYDDVSYELKLEEPKNELSVVEDKHELKIESPAENKLELLGNLVRLNNNSTHAECIFINDVTISFTTGHNYVLLDLSEYINSDVLYYPVVMLQDFVATHIASRCIFNNSSKKLRLFCDDVTTGPGEAGNTIILIPTISDAIQIEGITNGQYNGDYDRYYTKSEIDSALEGKQDKLTFDTTPTENSTNPVTSGGIYTALSGKVNNTGNETVAGNKTFTGSIIFSLNVNQVYSSEEYKGFYSQCTGITKGTAPTTNTGISIASQDSTSLSGTTGRTAEVTLKYKTNGSTEACLVAYKPEQSSTTSSSMGIIYPASGDPYTYAPTPAVSDDSTKIATTAYVNNKFVEVNALPASPDPDIWYAIPEV